MPQRTRDAQADLVGSGLGKRLSIAGTRGKVDAPQLGKDIKGLARRAEQVLFDRLPTRHGIDAVRHDEGGSLVTFGEGAASLALNSAQEVGTFMTTIFGWYGVLFAGLSVLFFLLSKSILKKNLKLCVDWSKINKKEYLAAMEKSVTDVAPIKALLQSALTDRINDREMFMKGIDYSYYYEQVDEITGGDGE